MSQFKNRMYHQPLDCFQYYFLVQVIVCATRTVQVVHGLKRLKTLKTNNVTLTCPT